MASVLKRLSTGYWHLRVHRQCWAQWPIWREPEPGDCFVADNWPEIRDAWELAIEQGLTKEDA